VPRTPLAHEHDTHSKHHHHHRAPPPPPPGTTTTAAAATTTTAAATMNPVSAFGAALFSKMTRERGEGSVVMSPFSMWTALAMAEVACVKDSDASAQLRRILEYDVLENHDLRAWYMRTTSSICEDDPAASLKIANALFATGEVKGRVAKWCSTVFAAKVEPLGSHQDINAFVVDKTNGIIKNLLSKDPEGPAVLVNAIFFDGAWTTKFDEKKTYSGLFRPYNQRPTPCEMMTMTEPGLEYGRTQLLEIVKLSYGPLQEFCAYVVVPTVDDASAMQDAIQQLFGTRSSFDEVVKLMRREKVQLSLPRFSAQGGADEVKHTVMSMGATAVFQPGGLGRLTDDVHDFIGDIAHKAAIRVDERGTRAAAATAVQATRGIVQIKTVKADRPFIFVVSHVPTKTLLFVARVNNVE
jgi:serpin B